MSAPSKPRILIIGDAVVPTGFARVIRNAKAISGPILLKPLAERAATKARFAPNKSERTGILTYRFK